MDLPKNKATNPVVHDVCMRVIHVNINRQRSNKRPFRKFAFNYCAWPLTFSVNLPTGLSAKLRLTPDPIQTRAWDYSWECFTFFLPGTQFLDQRRYALKDNIVRYLGIEDLDMSPNTIRQVGPYRLNTVSYNTIFTISMS